MNLLFDLSLASQYKSASQKARVMSEAWIESNMYCPCCGNDFLTHYENNRPVADFYCNNCGETFEVKSKEGNIGRKIADGAYQTAIERITGNSNPDLFVLRYSSDYQVTGLLLIPKYFFVPTVIEKRKPLAQSAHRAGWVGCNILYSDIPAQGKITIIDNGIVSIKEDVLYCYNRTKCLQTDVIHNREWLLDIIQCINNIKNEFFSLSDMYSFENTLYEKHPNNNNIKAKIRQQLQILRDKGYIRFLGNGYYQKII
ncbi:MAG: restriction endonuclease [Clostridia bacterium]|nr:restriction endonuclease [Clostridia bacterium]